MLGVVGGDVPSNGSMTVISTLLLFESSTEHSCLMLETSDASEQLVIRAPAPPATTTRGLEPDRGTEQL